MSARRAPWDEPVARPTLGVWAGTEGTDRLATIEDDVARLTRDLATARSDLAEHDAEARADRRDLLLELLEVTDAFGRVFANVAAREAEVTRPMRAWVGNFRAVSRLLGRTLDRQGVTPIETPTREFDPQWHTAVETVVEPTLPVGTIVEEIARGYVWQHQVLRRASVVVVREDDEQDGGRATGLGTGTGLGIG